MREFLLVLSILLLVPNFLPLQSSLSYLFFHPGILSGCLDFETRFWTNVLRSWLGNTVWLSLGSWTFLWCKCTKIIGKTCHALNSLLSPTIWAYQPLPIHRVKWTSASAQGGWGGRAAQGLSYGCEISRGHSVSHVSALPTLYGIYAQPGTMTNFTFSALLTF